MKNVTWIVAFRLSKNLMNELWMYLEMSWVDGRSALVVAGCIATMQLRNVALFATARDWINRLDTTRGLGWLVNSPGHRIPQILQPTLAHFLLRTPWPWSFQHHSIQHLLSPMFNFLCFNSCILDLTWYSVVVLFYSMLRTPCLINAVVNLDVLSTRGIAAHVKCFLLPFPQQELLIMPLKKVSSFISCCTHQSLLADVTPSPSHCLNLCLSSCSIHLCEFHSTLVWKTGEDVVCSVFLGWQCCR